MATHIKDVKTISTTTVETEQKEKKPGFVARLRNKWPWFDHVMRAVGRFTEQQGRFYAGGITYFSILGIFPVLMVAFAIAGIVLFNQPELLGRIQDMIVEQVPGAMGEQISELIDTAVEQRSAVGVIGLLTALYSGLGWIGNLRDGITAQWALTPRKENFFKKKIKDLLALLGLFLSFGLAMLVSGLGSSGLIKKIVGWLRLDNIPGIGVVLAVVSLAISLLAIWLVMLWVIGYLPRERAEIKQSMRAALIAAVLLVVWIQIAAYYLKSVLSSPAGAVFGPIIGIMVFLFFTWQIVLLSAAWAATADDSGEPEEDVVEEGETVTVSA